jgi:hypothetical protein
MNSLYHREYKAKLVSCVLFLPLLVPDHYLIKVCINNKYHSLGLNMYYKI